MRPTVHTKVDAHAGISSSHIPMSHIRRLPNRLRWSARSLRCKSGSRDGREDDPTPLERGVPGTEREAWGMMIARGRRK